MNTGGGALSWADFSFVVDGCFLCCGRWFSFVADGCFLCSRWIFVEEDGGG